MNIPLYLMFGFLTHKSLGNLIVGVTFIELAIAFFRAD